MQLFLQASAASLLARLADIINDVAWWAISITIGVAVALLLIRWVMDAMQTSPFGKLAYYLRRPTDNMISHAHSSRFYYPLRQALKFNPAILMVLIGLAIVWYVVLTLVGNLTTVIMGLAMSVSAFGNGSFFNGLRYLIGSLLLGAIFFLMGLMTLVFVNWISGLFERASFWALQRIGPLLRVFEFGGAFAGWSFLILWIALSFAASAVRAVFFL